MDLRKSPIEGTSSDKHDKCPDCKPLDADELEAKKIPLKNMTRLKSCDSLFRINDPLCLPRSYEELLQDMKGTSSDEDNIFDQLARKSLVNVRLETKKTRVKPILVPILLQAKKKRLQTLDFIKLLGRDRTETRNYLEAKTKHLQMFDDLLRPYPKLTIKVQALNGQTCTVEAYRFDRAKDVKAKACEKLRLSTERRTLVYNGKELDDMSDLSSIDTSVECKFQLLPKTGLGLVDSVKSLFEYFRNGAHRLVEWFPDFFMDMSRALTEKDLSRISQAIGRGWQHLGAELGLSQAAIEQICEDNGKTSMKIFNMLRQWSIKDSVNATVNTLHNAMKNCRKVTFDMKAIERVFAGI